MLDLGEDAVGRLATLLGCPRESLTAFAALSDADLTLLADAIDASFARRRELLDSELARTLPAGAAPAVASLLRSPGIPPLRKLLIGRGR
jgi:hypothetical protein